MSEIVPVVPAGGNIITPAEEGKKEKKKQISPAVEWCFTLNNYTCEELNEVSSKVPLLGAKYIVGHEIGKKGTPHLQGYIYFKKKCRPKSHFKTDRIYWEKTKGKIIDQNYCGDKNKHPENKILFQKGIPKPTVLMTRELLWPRQIEIVDKYMEDEDPLFGRKVHWYWEVNGNWGKSQTCTHMIDFMGAMEVSGANSDVLCGVTNWIEKNEEAPRIIIFDIPRCNHGAVSYQAIEKIKDGKFFSGKYESGMCRFNRPHIVCFSNEAPAIEELSEDRWEIFRLEGDDIIEEIW